MLMPRHCVIFEWVHPTHEPTNYIANFFRGSAQAIPYAECRNRAPDKPRSSLSPPKKSINMTYVLAQLCGHDR